VAAVTPSKLPTIAQSASLQNSPVSTLQEIATETLDDGQPLWSVAERRMTATIQRSRVETTKKPVFKAYEKSWTEKSTVLLHHVERLAPLHPE